MRNSEICVGMRQVEIQAMVSAVLTGNDVPGSPTNRRTCMAKLPEVHSEPARKSQIKSLHEAGIKDRINGAEATGSKLLHAPQRAQGGAGGEADRLNGQCGRRENELSVVARHIG